MGSGSTSGRSRRCAKTCVLFTTVGAALPFFWHLIGSAVAMTASACNLIYPLDGLSSEHGDREEAAKPAYLYVVGGSVEVSSSTNPFSQTVYFALLGDDGAVGAWKETSSLPIGVTNHTVAIHGDYLYVTGGQSSSAAYEASIYVAPILESGELGSWSAATHPFPLGRYDHGSAVHGDWLFVVGGVTSTGLTNEIIASRLSSGANGPWVVAGSLPKSSSLTSVISHDGHIVTLGGRAADNSYLSTVGFFSVVGDGQLGERLPAPFLPRPVAFHEAACLGDLLFVVGGVSENGVLVTTDTIRSRVGGDGSFSAWEISSNFDGYRWDFALAAGPRHVYVLGGRDINEGPFLSNIEVGEVVGDGEIIWRHSDRGLQQRLASQAAVVRW